jgi:putative phosphoribosyl transferase
MIFADRTEAGRLLGRALACREPRDPVVLAIPRGGVVIGVEVARLLHHAPLDIVVPRKLGAPNNPELGIGAIAEGVVVLDPEMVARLGVSDGYLRQEISAQDREIERRTARYREDRAPVDLAGRTAIVVDDGIATGGTAVAALRWAGSRGAERVIMAVPVAPPAARSRLDNDAEEVVVLEEPELFYAVGQWYADFSQVTDDEVVAMLREHASPAPPGDRASA